LFQAKTGAISRPFFHFSSDKTQVYRIARRHSLYDPTVVASDPAVRTSFTQRGVNICGLSYFRDAVKPESECAKK